MDPQHQSPESPNIYPPEANTVQKVVGNSLYYARAINPTMLVALNTISVEQPISTEATSKAVTQLLNYVATHSEAITKYHESGMILHIHSYDSFLSEPVAKSRVGGYHCLSTASPDLNNSPLKQPPLNGPVHVKCTTMINILAIPMEAELGSLFVNCQIGAETRMALIDMVHAQPLIPSVIDSATGDRFVNDNIRQSRSRAIGMQFYWVKDRLRKLKFLVYWMAG